MENQPNNLPSVYTYVAQNNLEYFLICSPSSCILSGSYHSKYRKNLVGSHVQQCFPIMFPRLCSVGHKKSHIYSWRTQFNI